MLAFYYRRKMPPIRMLPTKPMRTERTHEENQERAYIAASRRSDRSLEARVESARRASEIHKKRTGRSLRVREEDVMNEEMYEEEDDDLPMQFRRISALNPNFLGGRINSYLIGQQGLRDALHDAIYNANQANQFQQNQFFNPAMNQNGMQQPGMMQHPQAFTGAYGGMQNPQYPMNNMQQGIRPNLHHRSSSIATPQELMSYNQNASMKPSTPMHMDSRRMSVPASAISPGFPSPAASHPKSASSSHPPTPHITGQSPQQAPTPYSGAGQESYRASAGVPPVPSYDQAFEESIYPLTTKLPLATQQLMGSNATHPSQLSPGLPTGGYSYNPNGKPKRPSSNDAPSYFNNGLDQTLSSADMGPTFMKNEPQSTSSGYDNTFDAMMAGKTSDDFNNFGDLGFDLTPNEFGPSGQVTPGSTGDLGWADDFFNYDDATANAASTGND